MNGLRRPAATRSGWANAEERAAGGAHIACPPESGRGLALGSLVAGIASADRKTREELQAKR